MSLVDPANEAEVTTQLQPETQDNSAELDNQVDESIPEKFRGKSLAEVVQSYQNLESELGRARNEVGTSRRVLDEVLDLRRRQAEKSEAAPTARAVTPHELAENPEEVITEVAKRVADERTSSVEQRLAKFEGDLAAQQFEKKHTGYAETIQSPKFVDWVGKTPTRMGLVQKAAQQDWAAAEELLELYKEYEGAPSRAQETPGADKADAKKVGLAKSGGSGANRVVNGGDGKTIFKRTELARLYVENPTEYDRRFESEFRQAYEENRVK